MSNNRSRMPDVSHLTNVRAAHDELNNVQFRSAEEAGSAIKAVAREVMDTKEVVAKMLNAWSDFSRDTGAVNSRLSSIEQIVASGDRGGRVESSRTAGQVVVESDQYRALAGHQSGKVRINATTLTTGTSSGGALGPADRSGIVSGLAQRRIRFRDVLAQGQTNSTSVEFVRQTARTNNAGMQVETEAKGEAELAYETVQAPVRTLAVLLPASKQILDDAPMLRSIIDSELRYMIADKEEDQLINGNGIGANLTGVLTSATAYAAPFDPAGTETMVDVLLLAIAQLEVLNYQATFIAMNPLDWRRLQLLKDTTGRYLANGPFTAEQVERLWSTPVVATQAIAVDKFLVGDGQRGAQIFDRQESTIEISTEHSDFFARNMVMLRAEERLAFAIYKPGAFILGDFGNVA